MADAWHQLDPEQPVLLLPVRLETQTMPFLDPGDPDEPVRLRVRIYPDDLALDRDADRPRLLPDRFEVVARAGEQSFSVTGKDVSLRDLGFGGEGSSDPGARLSALASSLDELADGSGTTRWLTDYRAAEEAGMAVTVELPPGTTLLDSLVVVGSRSGRLPEDEAAEVLATLRAHGTDAGFLLPGAPTNNSEAARSAWSRPPAGPGGPPPAIGAPVADSAAGRLDVALGLTEVMPDWPAADDRGDSEAGAMATALWPVTWGGWMDSALRPGVVDARTRDQLRRHVAAELRGRGPLPLIRVADQPYGILPVTDLATFAGDTPLGTGLARVLRGLRPLWQHGTAGVPSVTRTGVSALPEILGQSPVSWGLRARRLLGTGGMLATIVHGGSYEQAQARRDLGTALEALLGTARRVFAEPDLMGIDRTVGLPLVADTDPDVLTALADPVRPEPPVEPASVLQVLLGLAVTGARSEVDRLLAREAGARMLWWLGDDEAGLREALGEGTADLARSVLEHLVADEDPEDATDVALTRVHHVAEELSPVPGDARFPLQSLLGLRPPVEEDVTTRLAQLEELLRAAVLWTQVRGAVRQLATVGDTERRRGLLAETLDCASHRYDAWVTSLASRRLGQLRSRRPTGIVVGAYGWVEELPLQRRTPVPVPPEGTTEAYAADRGGLVHAPGLAHAATAAVLRGARLAHAPGDEADRALEMDLSSGRAREAGEVLAGVRGGQELGALLGYRFERWLHDTDPTLNRFVASFRSMAPSVVAKEVDRVASGEVDLGVESVAATQVVDGVRLLELFRADATRVRARLQDPPPALARYAAPWAPPSAADDAHLSGLLGRLERLLDAVSDLLLAEGVHQVVAGSTTRAAAAMDALSGDGLPPEPDVTAQPVDRAGLTHRVLLMLPGDGDVGRTQGWAETPRARANPALERWCRAALGPANRIVVARSDGRSRRLRALEVGALDLVEAAGHAGAGLEVFWARARRSERGLPPQPLVERPRSLPDVDLTLGEAWEVAASLRSVLAGSRPLQAADLVHDVHSDPVRSADAPPPQRLVGLRDQLLALSTASPAESRELVAVADLLAGFGIGAAVDAGGLDARAGEGTGEGDQPSPLAAHVAAAQAEAARRCERLAELLASATPEDDAAGRAQAVGSDLPVPLSWAPAGPTGDEPFAAAWAGAPADATGVRRWLARHARVRPAVSRYAETSLLRSALGRRTRLRGITLHAAGWLGESLPEEMSDRNARTSLVVESGASLDPEGRLTGLVVDSWHETLPRRRRVDDVAAPGEARAEPEEVATTGLAVHANGPGARAPQCLLLAVTPDLEPWSREKILAVVDGARDLARIRLVTLERLPLAATVLPAARVAHWSLQGEPVIDPRWLSTVADPSAVPSFVTFAD